MKYSDIKTVIKEKEESYKTGYRNGRAIGYILGFVLGILTCLGIFFYLVSRS